MEKEKPGFFSHLFEDFCFSKSKQCLQVYLSYLLKALCFSGFAPPRSIFQVLFLGVWYRGV